MPCRWYSPPPVPPKLVRSRAGRPVDVAVLVGSLLLGLVVPAAGCRGWRDAGDTYYAHRLPKKRARKEATFAFGMPGEGWRPLRKVEGVQVGWMRPELRGIIGVNVQCDEQGDSSLVQYTDHLRIDWTDWKVLEQTDQRLIERAALRTVATGRLDGVPMQLELWVVKRAGCLFDFTYVAAPDRFAQGQPQFAKVVGGFRYPP